MTRTDLLFLTIALHFHAFAENSEDDASRNMMYTINVNFAAALSIQLVISIFVCLYLRWLFTNQKRQ